VSVRVNGRLASNSSDLVREAVCAGVGIGFTPTWLFNREIASGEVVRLLAGYEPKPLPIHAVYPSSRRHASKVAAFVEHLRDRLATSA
jgi:DNA-binding transcriptional LysR family regulator